MSLFKVSKVNSESSNSTTQEIQSSTSEEEKKSNHQSKVQFNNSGANNLIIPFKDNSFSIEQYTGKEINTFYSKIKYIRKKYNINKSRKNHIDSVVKKAKSKFLKAIYDCLKFCLHYCDLNRLPQKFIINTRIEYNKKVLNKTLEEIYTEFNLLPTYEILVQNNMIKKDKQEYLYFLMKSKMKDIYKYYISSDLYKLDKKRIESKSGEGVVILYDFVATNICEYFLLNKGNNKRLNKRFNGINPKKIQNKKKQFEIEKKIGNKNLNIKFNIIKFEDNSIYQNKLKKPELSDDK